MVIQMTSQQKLINVILFIAFNDSCMHKSTQTLICQLAKHLPISLSSMRKSQHISSYISGIGGMCCEHIHAVDSWRKGPPQHDCIFVETDLDPPGILGLDIPHVQLFFSFTHNNVKYFCALVHWFSCMSESVDG